MRRPSFLGVAVALALLVTAVWWQLAEWRGRRESARAESLERKLAALSDSLAALRLDYEAVRRTTEGGLSEDDGSRLRNLGLADPAHELIADLARHPELIPFKGVLGGNMFFVASESAVLSGEWVYGYFEDGHVAGRCLLEYRVMPGGRILWKRLAATLD